MAGLAAAHRLLVGGPQVRVTVLEAAAEVGGKLRSGQVAGVMVDLGAESLLARRPEAVELATAVGLADDIVHPVTSTAGVWTRGAIRPLPPTLMGVPAHLRELARSGIIGRGGLLRAGLEPRLPPVDLSTDTSIGALVSRRLGREVKERLVEPLVGGVYAGRCDELSLFAAWPQVVSALQTRPSLLQAAVAHRAATRSGEQRTPAPVFAGLTGGVTRLATATAAEVERLGGDIRRRATVRQLTRSASGWRLTVGSTASPEVVEADAVIVAVPAAPAARLLGSVAAAAAQELSQIESASLALVTVAMRARDVDVDLAGSGFLVPPVDGTTIKAATYTSLKWDWLPDDLLMLRCSVGRHRDEAVLQRDDSELVEAAMLDLRRATGLRAPLVDADVSRWGGGLPQYAVGHLDKAARIRRSVASVEGLAVCGAAYDGVGVPAVIASAQTAAARVADHLRGRATMGP